MDGWMDGKPDMGIRWEHQQQRNNAPKNAAGDRYAAAGQGEDSQPEVVSCRVRQLATRRSGSWLVVVRVIASPRTEPPRNGH